MKDSKSFDEPVGVDVCFYYRTAGYAHSIEQVFADVRSALPGHVRQREFFCPFRRAEPVGMLRNGWHAKRAAAQINHITGDVNYLAPFLPRGSVIVTVHDIAHVETLRGVSSRLYRALWFDWPLRRADRVTFISDFTRREAERVLGLSFAGEPVVPNPVSERFVHDTKPFPAKTPTVLTLGTGSNKNLPRLAEALEGMDVKLRIVGALSPGQRDSLVTHRVAFTSAENLSAAQVVDEYRRADVVAMVSTYEGFGLPLVEAQAVGRPVLSSDRGPIPEVAGGGALLVDPLSVRDIRDGLDRLIRDRDVRERLVHIGLTNVKRFTKARVASQYAALYDEMGRSPRAAVKRDTRG